VYKRERERRSEQASKRMKEEEETEKYTFLRDNKSG
jgi:hypothetical protein